MGTSAKELITGMKQATAYARGRKTRGMRLTVVEIPDVESDPSRASHGGRIVSRPPPGYR
jgi:hypothetical protein